MVKFNILYFIIFHLYFITIGPAKKFGGDYQKKITEEFTHAAALYLLGYSNRVPAHYTVTFSRHKS